MSNKMEESTFEKDKTPYLVFACKKCQQFSYVKTSQKTKKCLRCGRSHQVENLLNEGEIVYGMTLAVNTVKRKQNELAIPEFRSQNDYILDTKNFQNIPKILPYSKDKVNSKQDVELKFKTLLFKLSKLYRKFPAYMIEIMTEDEGIPCGDVSILIEKFIKKGSLIRLKNEDYYFEIAKEK